jgi:hypothetical protein
MATPRNFSALKAVCKKTGNAPAMDRRGKATGRQQTFLGAGHSQGIQQ